MFVRRDLTDTVPTREGNMHFVKQGAGYPLVMLHPLGTSTWAWSSVIDAFSQHYTCYAFDMLGHGQSDKPARHFNIPDYAQALDDACQVLNIHRGHYLGNSVGAVLATEMAAAYPDRLDKLALVGPPVWDARTAPERIAEAAAGYDANGMPVQRTMAQARESTTFAEPRQDWVDAMNDTRAQAGVWVKKLHESLAWYDIMARLPLVKARETLVLYGEHDRLREGEELLHNNIVRARKHIMPGVGHIPQIEDPEGFVDAVLAFLKPAS